MGYRIKDLTGKIFGRLTIVQLDTDRNKEYKNKTGKSKIYWFCKCSCGNKELVSKSSYNLKDGGTQSCGCLQKEKSLESSKYRVKPLEKYKHVIGERFGKLVITELISKSKLGLIVKCECDCGNKDVKNKNYKVLKSGGSISCGCIQIASARELARKLGKNRTKSLEDYNYLLGKKYNMLTITGIIDKVYDRNTQIHVRVKCDCGNEKTVLLHAITHNGTMSCGCKLGSLLQDKISNYLEDELNYKVLHEGECSLTIVNSRTNKKLRFDNEITIGDKKLLIECHGKQHYDLQYKNSSWIGNLTPEEYLHKQKLYDRYKRIFAKSQGYYFLEIPFTSDDSEETYKKLIDDKIASIINK